VNPRTSCRVPQAVKTWKKRQDKDVAMIYVHVLGQAGDSPWSMA